MLNININKLSKVDKDKAGGLDTSSFSFPLSAELIRTQKIVHDNKKCTAYQHCEHCDATTGHVTVVNEQGCFITCASCNYGYKIGR